MACSHVLLVACYPKMKSRKKINYDIWKDDKNYNFNTITIDQFIVLNITLFCMNYFAILAEITCY